MKKFHDRVTLKEGYNVVVKQDREFKFIEEFGIFRLADKGSFEETCPEHETALVIFSGTCTIEAGDKVWKDIGKRETVFDGLPTCVYIPPGEKYSITGRKTDIGVCKARCEAYGGEPLLVVPEQVKVMQVGRDNWSREVRIMLGPDSVAKKMIIGETLNPAGNWSGTPPHRHENDNLPEESLHEELYYFRTDKPQGWGVERLYSPERDIDELIYLQDGTVTFMPWGYHQIVAGPGYTLYYLFFLAGEGTQLAGFEDPDHRWLKQSA